MKRLHISINVADLNRSVDFYSALFGEAPEERHDDIVKWRLTDPPVNFALSTRGGSTGVDHVGIQTESTTELETLRQRIADIDAPRNDQGETTCCYARSNKTWVMDPQNVPWELFHTHGLSETFGESIVRNDLKVQPDATNSCCRPSTEQSR